MSAGRIQVESNGVVLFTGANEVTIGGRTGCDVIVEDPVVAARHCRISWDGSFHVRDLGSVTGTWLDGKRAAAFTELADGSEIVIGVSRLLVRITTEGGVPSLVLDLQRCAFWWKKAGKGVFDNDPDAMVRSEVTFGRFPLLHLTNRIVAVFAVVLLVAAVLFASVFEPLADAGPLLPSHAYVRDLGSNRTDVHASVAKCADLADSQGCNVCHEPGAGTPEAKCLQCHDDLRQPATWRHPYFNDGTIAALPGQPVDAAFCTTCHRDHQGSDFLKAGSRDRIGQCDVCHGSSEVPFDREALLRRAPPVTVTTQQRPHSTIRFPHDRHTAAGMRCDLCHAPDPLVLAQRRMSAADDPDRQDFGEVPFETCAACHVPDAAPSPGMTTAEQATWRTAANDHQWPVAWHGTDTTGERGCVACHTTSQRDGATVFGPELTTVERPRESVEEYATERATYVAGRRMHDAEFQAHAGGRTCVECHVRGNLTAAAPRPASTFWHALHLAEGSLTPLAGNGASVSSDTTAGCVSCHHDRTTAKSLRAAADGAFTWPEDAATAAACRTCHSDGDRAVVLQATPRPIEPDRRRTTIAFPHDVHTGSAQFGQPGSPLADGCFACHEFATPTGGTALQMVPRTKAKAADCTQCHQDHDHIAGGSCQQCHPAETGRADSFLLSARVPSVAAPVRTWPAANGFSHHSPGHSGTDLQGQPITCAVCHDDAATRAAKTIGDVPVPDESHPSCRACHLQRQFHWR